MGTSPLFGLQITPTDEDTERKGRSFTAACLGWVTAPLLADSAGRSEAVVFLALAGPATTIKPFVFNFIHGNERAVVKSGFRERHDLRHDKARPLRYRWNRNGRQSLLLAWHSAFELEPDPIQLSYSPTLRFITMPRRAWIEHQAKAINGSRDPMRSVRAAHFCAFLSRRTRLPIANDPAFHLHLFDSALDEPWTVEGKTTSKAVRKIGLDAHDEPICCSVEPEEFEDWLRDRTREFFGPTVTTTQRAA